MNVKIATAASLLLVFSGVAFAQDVDPNPKEETPVQGRSYFDGHRQTVQNDRVQLFQFETHRLAREFGANTVVIHCPFNLNTMTPTAGNAIINYAVNNTEQMRTFLNGPTANFEMVLRNGRYESIDLNQPNPQIHHFYVDKDGNFTQLNDPAVRAELKRKHANGELDLTPMPSNSLEQLFSRTEGLARRLCFSSS